MRLCVGHSQDQLQQHAAGDERSQYLHGILTQLTKNFGLNAIIANLVGAVAGYYVTYGVQALN